MAIDILSAFRNPPPELDHVFPGFLSSTVGALVSPGGVGKSMLCLELGMLVAGGRDLLGIGSVDTGSVVYLPAEDPEPVLVQRLNALGQHLPESERQAINEQMVIEPLVGYEIDVLTDRWTDTLLSAATDRRLLILDTLRRFHKADENDSGAMAEVMARLEHVAARTGCAVLLVHHTSKFAAMQGKGDEQQASRGSSVLVDHARWQAFLAGMTLSDAEDHGVDPEERRWYVRMGVSKGNYGPPQADRWLERQPGGVLLPADFDNGGDNGETARPSCQGRWNYDI